MRRRIKRGVERGGSESGCWGMPSPQPSPVGAGRGGGRVRLDEQLPSRAERRRAKNSRRRARSAQRLEAEKERKAWQVAAGFGEFIGEGGSILDLRDKVRRYGWWGTIWRHAVLVGAVFVVVGVVVGVYLWWTG